MMSAVTTVMLAMALQTVSPTPPATWGLPLEGEAAENFLRTARVVSVKTFKTFKTNAITRPKKIELSDGERTAYALFKTVDEREPMKHFDDGRVELLFTDSFEYEIAASRAFRTHLELRKEKSLARFSRPVLAALAALTEDDLEERLGKWLTKRQIESLWVRRNLILELAERRVEAEGEDAVLFD